MSRTDNRVPVRNGWFVCKTGEKYCIANDDKFRLAALGDLYIAIDPGSSGLMRPGDKDQTAHYTRLLDEIAIYLVGGVPEEFEEYT